MKVHRVAYVMITVTGLPSLPDAGVILLAFSPRYARVETYSFGPLPLGAPQTARMIASSCT